MTNSGQSAIAFDDCCFYHTLDLPSHGTAEGLWDLRGRFEDYTGHVPFTGRTVLDVGTASGFLTWEAEKRGATVTSTDLPDATAWVELPIHGAAYVDRHEQWLEERNEIVRQIRNSFWLAHCDFGSRARCEYLPVYDVGPRLGEFDIVLVGQLLVHVPDAIRALAACASVCRNTIVITEGNFPIDEPLASLCGRANLPELGYAWYHYSHGWYREVLTMLGFRRVTITAAAYPCNQDDHADSIELATVIGER